MYSKRKITFDIVKRVNTNYNIFERVIYFLKNEHKIIIEDFNEDICFTTDGYNIKNYIYLSKPTINWSKDIYQNYIKFSEGILLQVVPLFKKIKTIKFKIDFDLNNKKFKKINFSPNKNFKIKAFNTTDKKSETANAKINLECFLPVFPIYVQVQKGNNGFYLNKIFMKIKNKYYSFPYGNVQQKSNSMCLGIRNKKKFKSIKDIFINIFTTPFNHDYSFNLKFQNKLKYFKLDLNYIHLKIHNKKDIHLIEMFYYLSQVIEAENLEYQKIFYLIPERQIEWEENYSV